MVGVLLLLQVKVFYLMLLLVEVKDSTKKGPNVDISLGAQNVKLIIALKEETAADHQSPMVTFLGTIHQ